MKRAVRGPARSASDRLRALSRRTGEDHQFVLQRYATERFLYRLGASPHRDRFVLKGAALLVLWGGSAYRPTRDVDLALSGAADQRDVLAALREVCGAAVAEDDGLDFEVQTMGAEPIRSEAEYGGLRVTFLVHLGNARIDMQVDVGFGDALEPPPSLADYPALLDGPPPRIRVYSREAVVAEKLHAMVFHGERNSRFKDFHDVYALARAFEFDGAALARAIEATFRRRSTPLGGELPAALAPRFYADAARAARWRAYLTRAGLAGVPVDFGEVGEVMRMFLGEAWAALAAVEAFAAGWRAGGPWGRPRGLS